MSDNENVKPTAPYLCLKCGSEVEYFDLDLNSNSLIGAGGHCKIQLEGDEIESLHCILAMKEEGWLEVRDWNTGSTFVNGAAISEPTVMDEDDCLKIGDYEITVVLGPEGAGKGPASGSTISGSTISGSTISEVAATDSSASEAEEFPDHWSRPEKPLESNLQIESEIESEAAETESEEDPPIAVETFVDETPVEAVDQRVDEAEETRSEESTPHAEPSTSSEFVYDIDADFEDEVIDPSLGFEVPTFTEDTSIDADEMQILRMEIEQLKFELAQRNASSSQISDQLSRDQTVHLVSRLEDLLEELKRSDIRTSDMEELLRAADQATNDEREERKQIEKWVSELENRVIQREEETVAEVQQLKKLLNEAREAQQKSNECLKSVIETKTQGGEAVPTELANDLKIQIESLQLQLQTAQDEAASYRKQLEERFATTPSESKARDAEQKLATMQLETSRERAEISRQRAELKNLKADLEQRLSEPRELNVADTRIRAMREHLKELHDNEEKEKAEKREGGGSGLANRIASLLQRVTSN